MTRRPAPLVSQWHGLTIGGDAIGDGWIDGWRTGSDMIDPCDGLGAARCRIEPVA